MDSFRMNESMPSNSTLSLSREEMRSLGYRVIDLLVEHFDTQLTKTVMHIGKRADLEKRLREPLPEKATGVSSVINQLRENVLNHISHVDHPRFFAFVPSPSNFVSVMADTLAAGFNVFAGTWLEASGPAEIELVTLDWLRQLCNLPDTAGGLFVSGGSMANITALAVARHTKLRDQIRDAVAYYSDPIKLIPLLNEGYGCWGLKRPSSASCPQTTRFVSRYRISSAKWLGTGLPGESLSVSPFLCHRQRRYDQHGRRRSLDSAGRVLRQRTAVAPCRRGLRSSRSPL
jgi:hypothetical protein